MIIKHHPFRSEAEALDATSRTLEAALQHRHAGVSWRIARLAHELTVNEVTAGYAGPYRSAPDIATCSCAVCVSRRGGA